MPTAGCQAKSVRFPGRRNTQAWQTPFAPATGRHKPAGAPSAPAAAA